MTLEKHKQYVACYSDFIGYDYFGNSENKKDYIVSYNYQDLKSSVFWSSVYVHFSCFVFRREVQQNFIPLFLNDCTRTFSILKTGKVGHVSVCTFYKRERKGSLYYSFDDFEKSAREVLVVQAICNAGGFRLSSYARYAKDIRIVFAKRHLLREERFQKYFQYCQRVKNDYLTMLRDYDSLGLFGKITVRRIIIESYLLAKSFNSFYYIIMKKLFNKRHIRKKLSD